MGIRRKVLTPLALCGVVVAAALIAALHAALPRGFIHGAGPWLIAGAFLVVLLTATLLVEWRLRRPLQALLSAPDNALVDTSAPLTVGGMRDEIAALRGVLSSLRQRGDGARGELSTVSADNRALQERLRDLQERYELAVERANDGSWEWSLRTGSTDFSPRWKGMMHLSPAKLDHVDQWRRLIAPEDREAVLMRIENHVQGLTPHFDAEYRLRDGESAYRWIRSRGIAVRGASGSAYRLIVMDQDIHARKQLETLLIEAAEGLASLSGEAFFRALAEKLSAILGTRDNLVAYCIGDPPTQARTLAYYSEGKHFDNFDFELAGTSCEAVLRRGDIVYCPTGVCDIWPIEKQYDRDSYVGVPMFDSNGKIIGHFACMDGAAMRHDLPHLAIFRIFSVRAAIELERWRLKQQIEQTGT